MREHEALHAGLGGHGRGLLAGHVAEALELGAGLEERRLAHEQVGAGGVARQRRRGGGVGAVDHRGLPVGAAGREAGLGVPGAHEGDVEAAGRHRVGLLVLVQVEQLAHTVEAVAEGAEQSAEHARPVPARHVERQPWRLPQPVHEALARDRRGPRHEVEHVVEMHVRDDHRAQPVDQAAGPRRLQRARPAVQQHAPVRPVDGVARARRTQRGADPHADDLKLHPRAARPGRRPSPRPARRGPARRSDRRTRRCSSPRTARRRTRAARDRA